jgi:hypothetical protein
MRNPAGLPLTTSVDDELYDELSELAGQKIVHVAIWEDSLSQGLSESEADDEPDSLFDLDLYLEDGVYFELYGTRCYADIDSEPWGDLATVTRHLLAYVKQGLWLEEVAVNESDELVLVLARNQIPLVYLEIGGWLIEEWDELPDT